MTSAAGVTDSTAPFNGEGPGSTPRAALQRSGCRRQVSAESWRDRQRLIETGRKALAAARTVEEVKDIRDTAQAIKAYLRQQSASLEAQNHAAELKLWAERPLGEMLTELPKQHGARPGDMELQDATPSLRDLGIEKTQSHRWQLEARLPEHLFTAHIETVKRSGGELTSIALQRKAKDWEQDQKRADDAIRVEHVEDLRPLVGEIEFSTIVVDPPWDFADERDVNQLGRARPAYHTLSIDEIKGQPIGRLASDNAHLYLWITNRSLFKGRELLEEWGFRYITVLTWIKPTMGMGNYFRGSSEQILFGIRGSLPLKRHDVGTWFAAPRPGTEHSAKPPEFDNLVESCSPGPYGRFFERSERDGWFSWGPT